MTGFKKEFFYAYAILILILSVSCGKPAAESNLLLINGSTMGTTFSVKIVKNNFLHLGNYSGKAVSIEKDINSILEKVNNLMSTYRENSEISKFNRYRGSDWFDVSDDTAVVVKKALEISRKSGGKFDITVGPLVNLWGFGKDFSSRKVPPEKEIIRLRKRVGYRYLHVKFDPPALKKDIPELYCDLSAIAKGFGVDKVAEYLNSKGFYNYLVEIGGEIRVRGKNGKGNFWNLGIQSPEDENELSQVVHVTDLAMATSGDYHNYFEVDGIRYSHTIDPVTGYPIRHNLVSVTVFAENCMSADALATAIDVMGPEEGFDFGLKENIPLFLIKKEMDKFVKISNPLFNSILNKK